ncbi:MAG TPA: hypothetical protein VGB05_01910, partial [Pyrinomonadaceae bacterium]
MKRENYSSELIIPFIFPRFRPHPLSSSLSLKNLSVLFSFCDGVAAAVAAAVAARRIGSLFMAIVSRSLENGIELVAWTNYKR